MKLRGRPKFSEARHLGLKDELSYAEVKEMLIQVYEKNGVAGAREVLRMFHVERLSELDKARYPRFVRICRDKLNPQ